MRTFLISVAVLLLAAPAVAYTIYLEDGSRIIAAEKYRVEGDRAIILLPSGTETFLDVDEIDVERTREANQQDYGDALVVEDGRVRQIGPEQTQRPRDRSLSDVASERDLATGIRDPARAERREAARSTSPAPGAPDEGTEPLPLTPAGNVDLGRYSGSPLGDRDLQQRIERLLRARNVQSVEVLEGTRPERVFLRFTTNSETAVFRALAASAQTLLQLLESRAALAPSAFELLMITDNGSRAGQFLLTPELARDLVSGRIDISDFYVEHVLF